jgi:hypothetical protein
MQDREVRRQNAHKLLIRGYVLEDNRAALPKRSRACADVCETDSLEEIQELVGKARLRFDLEIPRLPVH